MNFIRSMTQWHTVLARHQKRLSWPDRFAFVWTLLRAACGLWPVAKVERQRRDACCQRCPIFNREFRMCRPYFGSALGCGCFQPLILFQSDPNCWADLAIPAEKLGWNAHARNS